MSSTQTSSQSNFLQTLISTVLSKITLTGTGVTKTDSWNGNSVVDGDGILVAEITNMEQPNCGLPDWIFTIALTGMTLPSVDTDKQIIMTMFSEALNSVCALTKSDFASGCCGILQVGNAVPRFTDEEYVFTLEFKIVFTDITF